MYHHFKEKDADALDCSLLENAAEAYKEIKDPEVCKAYFKRFNDLRIELNLPTDPNFVY